MCKQRWRPYLKYTPSKIISDFGPILGPAILEKNASAICEAAISLGRWIVLIGGSTFHVTANGIFVPATFDDFLSANSWLLGHLRDLDLYFIKGDTLQPDCITYDDNSRVAYRTFSPLAGEYVVAEAITITQDNKAYLQGKYMETIQKFQSQTEGAQTSC